jgi:hypothetical protein
VVQGWAGKVEAGEVVGEVVEMVEVMGEVGAGGGGSGWGGSSVSPSVKGITKNLSPT